METVVETGYVPLDPRFKSHHSGMETCGLSEPAGAQRVFKSHHSGMETSSSSRQFWVVGSPLNRTIVGWKHGPGGLPDPGSVAGFKSHHSGMETEWITAAVETLHIFKSHHSGMETWALGP